MKKYTIDSFNELDYLTKEFQTKEGQVIFSLTSNVDGSYFIRKVENKLIVVTNELDSPIKWKIELEPRAISNNPHWEFNATSFSFGNKKIQKVIFINITFSHEFCEYSDIVTIEKENLYGGKSIERIESTDSRLFGCREILFMEASNDCSLTFFNCTFVNNTNKKFKVISKNNSFLNFVNCKFNGDFLFENLDQSIIVNN